MIDRQPIKCPDCSGVLHLSKKPQAWCGGSEYVYLCENWPECRGLMSAHADGRPCGTPADAYTRKARSKVHALFDPLWSDVLAMYGPDCPLQPRALQRIARNRAYKWPAHHMSIPSEGCHIAMMDLAQLRQAWRTLKRYNPTPESIRAWSTENNHGPASPTIRRHPA